MIFKCSRIVLTFMALASFCSVAETIVPGSEVIANADVVVVQDSTLALTITPTANLTVADIKNGAGSDIARLKVSGNNAAVRLLNATPGVDYCAYIFGTADATNKIEVCLKDPLTGAKFDANGITYYKADAGDYWIRGSNDNKNPALTQVGADTYELAMELVQYTL